MSYLDWTELRDARDWHWYKKSIDAQYRVEFNHGADPTEFPAKVKSEHDEDSNGCDYIYHTFLYRQRVKCDSCESVKIVWPEGLI